MNRTTTHPSERQGKRFVPIVIGPAIRRLGLCALLTSAPLVIAQSGGGYDLHWKTIDAGGGTVTGASGYSLSGSVARQDASPLGAATAGGYALRGGFWPGVGEGDVIFRSGFEATP
jgi:hypothetical protein